MTFADQRFYASSYGRFNSPDPYAASGGTRDPGSWNRYSYVQGDPINASDPQGLWLQAVGSTDCPPGMVFNNGSCFAAVNDGAGKGVPNGGGGGGGGSGPRPLNPQQAWTLAKSYQTKVAAGNLTDCQALAGFSDDAAASGGTNDQFVSDFGVLVPKGTAASIGLNSYNTAAVALNTGQASGYQSIYQNTIPDNQSTGWNGDQGHHFAAFFEFGYQYGGTAGSITSALYEWAQAAFGGNDPINMGDIQSGISAALIGSGLKSGDIAAGAVGGMIRNSICNH